MAELDLLITGGAVVDGTGAGPTTADVAVKDGRIVEVGRVDGTAARTIDADGALVTPGFVDIHTHYDGQATWDDRLVPSSWHGVTTTVMGNCGVGFAPCRPEDRERLIELMEGVEDIPGTALHEGLPWTWETFPEYLDHLDARRYDIDVAAQVPHGAVRLHVMGERGAAAGRRDGGGDRRDGAHRPRRPSRRARSASPRRAPPTTRRAGASRPPRSPPPRTSSSASPPPSAGGGVLEVVSDFRRPRPRVRHPAPDGRGVGPPALDLGRRRGPPGAVARPPRPHRRAPPPTASRSGARSGPEPSACVLGLQATLHPFLASRTFREIAAPAAAPSASRALQRPAGPGDGAGRGRRHATAGLLDRLRPHVRARRPARLRARPGHSVAAHGRARPASNRPSSPRPAARRRRRDLPLLPAPQLGRRLARRRARDAGRPAPRARARRRRRPRRHDLRRQLRRRRCSRTGARDRDGRAPAGVGGAPSVPRRPPRPSACVDRGALAPGLQRRPERRRPRPACACARPYMAFDLPAGGKRLLQRADGYLHTFVAGEETYATGEQTGRPTRPAGAPGRPGRWARSVTDVPGTERGLARRSEAS